MNISVTHYSKTAPRNIVADKDTVIIDVLRATSTIVAAVANGIEKIYIVSEIDDAFALAEKIGRQKCILAGERDTCKIQGFDYGNSPVLFAKQKIDKKILILTTTNGTRAIHYGIHGRSCYIAALLNLSSVADIIQRRSNDTVIICSGLKGEAALEDTLCAGMLIDKLSRMVKLTKDINAEQSHQYYLAHQDTLSLAFRRTAAALKLKKAHADDIDFCLQFDCYSLSPRAVVVNNNIVIDKGAKN